MVGDGSRPHTNEAIRKARADEAEDGEPLDVDERKVVAMNSALYVNSTDYGRRTLGLEQGDTVEVATYRNCIVIRRKDEGQRDD